MLIYADPKTSVTLGDAVAGLKGLSGRDHLIAWGMLEQGLADVGIELGDELPNNVPTDLRIDLKTPEGFAFYQLYPEQYQRASEQWSKAAPRMGPVVVIGLRSIGTTLSRVVSHELRAAGLEVRRCTVRPEGDPFKRSVRLPEWVGKGAEAYLIVDEGPGLSGSSFVSVATKLEEMGVKRERIYFFPSHRKGPGSAANEITRRLWEKIQCWVAEPELPALDPAKNWKYIGPTLPWPFDCSGGAERCARRNAELSCGVPVLENQNWWLGFAKTGGRKSVVAPEVLGQHISAVADEPLRLEDEIETEARLREMITVNVAKYFRREELTAKVRCWLDNVALERGKPSSGDGQLGPADWIEDPSAKLWKLNTTGSKLSHFIPYRLSFVWDVAQAIVEWDLSASDEDALCKKVRAGNLPFGQSELHFFVLAAAAFELGKAVMFGGERSKYAQRLLQTASSL